MLLEYLSIEYDKRLKFQFGLFPSPALSVSVVEPYNTVLALNNPTENTDLIPFFENGSIFKLCERNLDIQEITYSIINRLVAQVNIILCIL